MTHPLGTVVVVGSANVDVVARVPRIPGPGETVMARGLTRGGGGKGANQAVAAARAGGVPTWFVGRLGGGDDGALLRSSLEDAGVRLDGVVVSSLPTGTALISVSDDGENAIVVVGGANADFSELSDAQRRRVSEADVVLAQLEVPVSVVLAAARARATGARFVLNAAPSQPLPSELLSEVDVLVVNEHELADLTGAALDGGVATLARQVPALVVTWGSRGCLVRRGDEEVWVDAVQVEAVDTTGAGDTFCGVMGARLAVGDDLVDAARWGAAAAALTVQRHGAQDAVPTHEELAELVGTT